MYAAEAMFWAANRRNDPHMEAVSKAQDELQKIETQIAQLQGAAGSNQEAQKQLQGLHERVEALRRQMSGQLTAWERTELARHANRPYPLDYIERPILTELFYAYNFTITESTPLDIEVAVDPEMLRQDL